MRKISRADDAVPTDYIRLADAFFRVLEAARRKPEALDRIPEWAEDNLWLEIQTFEEEEKPKEHSRVAGITRIKAACLFRIALYEELNSYVWDPYLDKSRLLNPDGWFFRDERVPTEFSNWISDDETPGPGGTEIRGKQRPVLLLVKEFDEWLRNTFDRRSIPRKKRAGSYQTADAPIIAKMREKILSGEAKSAREAAKLFLSEASGYGVPVSKETRLCRAYYEQYPPS